MAPYDTAVTADCFAQARHTFNYLIGQLTDPAAGTQTHDHLEELLVTQGRELQRQLLQAHLDLRARRERQAVSAARARARRNPAGVVGADGVIRRRVETGHHRLPATVFGTVTLTRCAWRAPNTANLYPAGEQLSLPGRRHSHGLAPLVVAEAVRGSFDTAHAAITARCGTVIGKRQIEDLLVVSAQDIDAFYAEQTPQPRTGEELLVLSFDGKGIAMRPDALRPATAKAAARAKRTVRTRLAGGEKPARKPMATLGVIYDAAWALTLPAGNVHQVITDLKRRADTLPADRRNGIDTTIGYLANNADHLRYDHALAHGWPIATGVIEGACRHLIADRFNLAGARWGLAAAEAMLKLRALSTNQDLDRYWAYHLRREHERTHHQHQYALTA